MYLFIDTETTGLPENYNNLESYNNVRLVQIAWIIYDLNGKKLSKRDFIVKPDGFEIPASSSRIHKISNSFAIISGKSIIKVLLELNAAIRSCSYLIAHNLNFDYNVLLSEFKRAKITTSIESLNKICTMKSTTDFCGITSFKGYKWPSLSELYNKVFGQDLIEAHNATVDIEATAKCFWHLKKNKLVNFDNRSNESTLENVKTKINSIPIYIPKKTINTNNQTTKRKSMNFKERAIGLKSYCESIKDGDSVSKKQLEKLCQMLDELILVIEEEDNVVDWSDIPSKKTGGESSSNIVSDDLPF